MAEGGKGWRRIAAGVGAAALGITAGVWAASNHHSPEASQNQEPAGISKTVDSTVMAIASAADTLRYANNPHTKAETNGDVTTLTTTLPGPNGTNETIEVVTDDKGDPQGTFDTKNAVMVNVTGVKVTGEGKGQLTTVDSVTFYNTDTQAGRDAAAKVTLPYSGKSYPSLYQQIVSGQGWQARESRLLGIKGAQTSPRQIEYNSYGQYPTAPTGVSLGPEGALEMAALNANIILQKNLANAQD